MKKLLQKIDKCFHVSERGTTIGNEIAMGVLVFFAIVYVLPINSSVLGSIPGTDTTAIFIATALCSAIACLIMGLVGNYPLVLSAGMGISSYLTYTVCSQTKMGFSWGEALTLTFISGAIFFVITMTPLRKWIVNAIPNSIKSAITVALGAFLAMIGLKGCGIIGFDKGLPSLETFNNPTVLLGLGAILLSFALSQSKGFVGKLSIAITMGITVVVGLILGALGVPGMPKFSAGYSNIGENFAAFGENFAQCFDFAGALSNVSAVAAIFSLVFVSLFDTTGTLIAVGKEANVLDERGQLTGGKKVMLADATGALLCGLFGTSTLTPLAESTIGTSSGAKTGITAIVTGLLFALSTLLYPVFTVFAPIDGLTPVTSFALVSVGASMFKKLSEIDWKDPIITLTSFVIVIITILSYSISDGLGMGLIVYTLLMLVAKRGKQVNPTIYAVSAFYLVNFVILALVA